MANPIDYFGDISLHGGALKEVAIEQVETLPVDNLVKGRIVLFSGAINYYDGSKWVVIGSSADVTALAGRVSTAEGKITTLEGKVSTLETKMATIEEGAEVNIIESIEIDGVAQAIADKKATLDLSAYAKKADLTTVFKWQGTKATVDALPASGNTVGDVYHVTEKSAEYVWNGTAWEELGSIVDLSDYYTKGEIDTKVSGLNTAIGKKVDALTTKPTAGTYTKVTINAEGQVTAGQAQIAISDISDIADAEVAVAGKLKTARNFSIIGGATASAVAFDGTDAVALNVTSIDGTKVSGAIPTDSVPTITSAKISDFATKVEEVVGAQFNEVSLSTASASGNTYTLTTAGKAFGVMVFNGDVQVFVSTTVTANSIVLDFNSAITPANFSVTYIEKF